MAMVQPVTMLIYEEDKRFIEESTLKYPNIETGGDLFGLWRNESEVVVTLVTGPGRDCRRTTTAFFQDRHYLSDVGKYLTSVKGLCNIGEWHSHHSLNLPEPSYGDRSTVWRNMPGSGLKRFLLIIATIKPQSQCSMPQNRRAEMNGFMFTVPANGSVRGGMIDVKSLSLPGPNPYRRQPEVVAKLKERAEMSVFGNEASNWSLVGKNAKKQKKREKKEAKQKKRTNSFRRQPEVVAMLKESAEISVFGNEASRKECCACCLWFHQIFGISKSGGSSSIPKNGGTPQNTNDFAGSDKGYDTTPLHQSEDAPFFFQDNPSGSVTDLAGLETSPQNTKNVTVVRYVPRSDQGRINSPYYPQATAPYLKTTTV